MELTEAQKNALKICRQKRIILLHGVTASGKTEVYLRRVAEVIEEGKQAIILVPEIALTPQTIERFSSRFKTAVLHSRLTPKEKRLSWESVISGEVDVVVGARSAIFAPFPNLGLIIIDEEHETSYKQDNNPRYHVREVAIKRSEYSGAQVVFGSATPALETFHLFQDQKDYGYCEMPERVDHLEMPEVHLVDMREELKNENRTVLSKLFREKLKKCLDNGEQAIILLNRRGYAGFLLCRECGATLLCPRCSVTLTLHSDNKLKCHYCDYEQSKKANCPKCQSIYFKELGTGTQKAEKELLSSFRNIKLLRMDKDTTKKRGSHKDILESFKSGEGNVLLGTQMIAKGLDFPGVTLVGVLNADSALHLPDFRSAERTFQLVTQVAGRSGRCKKGGEVIVQTYNPEHYALQAAKDHDYAKFYEQELEYRRELDYPPFGKLISLIVHSLDNLKAKKHIEEIAEALLAEENEDREILGPVPAAIPKIRNRYRWQILLKGFNELELTDEAPAGVQVDIDVDPINLL